MDTLEEIQNEQEALFDFAADCEIISYSKLAVCNVKLRNRFRSGS